MKLIQPGDILVCTDDEHTDATDHLGMISLAVRTYEGRSAEPKIVCYERGGLRHYGAELEYWEGWELL